MHLLKQTIAKLEGKIRGDDIMSGRLRDAADEARRRHAAKVILNAQHGKERVNGVVEALDIFTEHAENRTVRRERRAWAFGWLWGCGFGAALHYLATSIWP